MYQKVGAVLVAAGTTCEKSGTTKSLNGNGVEAMSVSGSCTLIRGVTRPSNKLNKR